MEFGPRALGARSIIADPRSPKMQKQLNLKVKYRESFRPFAPSILYENLSEWFNQSKSSPYMLYVADVKNEKRVLMTKKELKLLGLTNLISKGLQYQRLLTLITLQEFKQYIKKLINYIMI